MIPMKVIYDARWIRTDDKFDGVSRYSHELAWALSRRSDLEITWLIHDERQLAKLPEGPSIIANDPNDGIRELFLARRLNRERPDVVYSPFFLMGSFGKRYPLVLTIHDLIYFTHRTPPQWLAWHMRVGWRLFHTSYWPLRRVLNRADAIATVSNAARDELWAANATVRPISTVFNAPGEALTAQQQPSSKTIRSQSNHVLYMGAFTPYKNVECLIDATAKLPGVTLHLLSRIPKKRYDALMRRAESLSVASQVIFHDGVSDAEYAELLSDCRCLVTASKLEGFGLPIVEAQAADVPVACSDIPIFREVAGEGAVFFNPNSAEECAQAIDKLSESTTSDQTIARGRANIKRFSWDQSAEVAAAICQQVIKKS